MSAFCRVLLVFLHIYGHVSTVSEIDIKWDNHANAHKHLYSLRMSELTPVWQHLVSAWKLMIIKYFANIKSTKRSMTTWCHSSMHWYQQKPILIISESNSTSSETHIWIIEMMIFLSMEFSKLSSNLFTYASLYIFLMHIECDKNSRCLNSWRKFVRMYDRSIKLFHKNFIVDTIDDGIAFPSVNFSMWFAIGSFFHFIVVCASSYKQYLYTTCMLNAHQCWYSFTEWRCERDEISIKISWFGRRQCRCYTYEGQKMNQLIGMRMDIFMGKLLTIKFK